MCVLFHLFRVPFCPCVRTRPPWAPPGRQDPPALPAGSEPGELGGQRGAGSACGHCVLGAGNSPRLRQMGTWL